MQSSEIRRRLCHMVPGFLPFLLWPYSHRDPISPTLYYVVLGLTILLAVGVFTQYRWIERTGEQNQRFAAVAGYAASVLLTVLLFPGQLELGLTVLAILAFGDGSATFGGMLLGGPKLPWNPEKTVSGFLCFLLIGIPFATAVYWGEAHNLEALKQSVPVTVPLALAVAGTATAFAGIVESLRSKINDNIRVGIAASVMLVVMHGALVGFQQEPLESALDETSAWSSQTGDGVFADPCRDSSGIS